FLDEQTTHFLPFGAGLVSDELHAEDRIGVLPHFSRRLGELDAAALAAATGVDLRLDDPDLAAQLFGGLDRLVDGETRNALGRDDAELPQQFFCLVLMNFHVCPSIEVAVSVGPRTVDGTKRIFSCMAEDVVGYRPLLRHCLMGSPLS